MEILSFLAAILAAAAGCGVGYVLRDRMILGRLRTAQSSAEKVVAEAEARRKEILLEAKDEALKIRAEADREREEILSAAYREAEKLKGEGDAEATRIYSQAYSRNPQLFKLLRTLESYKKIFADNTTAILSSDSELLKILVEGERAAR